MLQGIEKGSAPSVLLPLPSAVKDVQGLHGNLSISKYLTIFNQVSGKILCIRSVIRPPACSLELSDVSSQTGRSVLISLVNSVCGVCHSYQPKVAPGETGLGAVVVNGPDTSERSSAVDGGGVETQTSHLT